LVGTRRFRASEDTACQAEGQNPEFPAGDDRRPQLARIAFDPDVMGGKPCIRGMRVAVGTIVGLIASFATPKKILAD